MPFIDSKITVSVSKEKKEAIKTELGQAIGILNKPEGFLMLGFEEEYDLYMGGKKLDKGAFISVSLFGKPSSQACEAMTKEICRIYEEQLGIPGKAVYITYAGFSDWGWDGRNF